MEAQKFATTMKTRSKTLARKVMLTLFFDISGPVLVKWMPKSATINFARYVDVKLHTNIKNHRKGRLCAKIMLLCDNMRPHKAGLTQLILTIMKFEVLMHLSYSPDLSLCNYEVFSSLKKFFLGGGGGERFLIDEEVKKVAKEWRLQVEGEFWRSVMYKFPEHGQKCIDRDGNYVEY